MKNSSNVKEVIISLASIHDARAENYQQASGMLASTDADLNALFSSLVQQSKKMQIQLEAHTEELASEELEHTAGNQRQNTVPKISSAPAMAHDRASILSQCGDIEALVQHAYNTLLGANGLPVATQSILESQKTELTAAYDHIKQLRDFEQNKKP